MSGLKTLFSQNPDLYRKFYYYPDPQSGEVSVRCSNPATLMCPQNYLFMNCSEGICIVNPAKRQMVIVNTSDANTAFESILKYQDW
jgi:hypothetical protein